MVLNGYGMGDADTTTPAVTTGTSSSWADIAKGLVQTAVPALVKQIGPGGQVVMAPPPASSGIPTPIIIIGAGVLGLVLWKMMSKKSRPAVSNPRRRRRSRRRSRRRGR